MIKKEERNSEKIKFLFFCFIYFFLSFSLNYASIEIFWNNKTGNSFFYLIKLNNTIPSFCSVYFYPFNTSSSKCYGFFYLNSSFFNDSNDAFLSIHVKYIFKGKNFSENKKILLFKETRNKREKPYTIIPTELVLTGKNILSIKSDCDGFLKIGKNFYTIKKGVNKIKITSFYRPGLLPVILKLSCGEGNYKEFRDYLLIKPSPAFCKIKIVNNKFPYFLYFNLTVKDQLNRTYYPKIMYFDTPILPTRNKTLYSINFPPFYPASLFNIKVYVDGRECEKTINLTYKNFFYSISTNFQKKAGISEIFLKNPYNFPVNLTLVYNQNNHTFFKQISLKANELKILRLPYSNYTIVVNNKTIYHFFPLFYNENEKLQRIVKKIKNTFLVLFLVILFFFFIIYILPIKEV